MGNLLSIIRNTEFGMVMGSLYRKSSAFARAWEDFSQFFIKNKKGLFR
jgi:hypothetical protein